MIDIDPSPLRTLPHRRFQPASVPDCRPRSALPFGVLGMIAMVGAIEVSVARSGTDYADPVSFGWVSSARAAVHEAPGREILCMGDSLVKHGLLPDVLEHETGRTAYNLAAAASPAPTTYFLLRRALGAGARPKAVILDFKPSLLAGGPRYRVRQWQELLNPWETAELALATKSLDFAAEVSLGAALPSLRARHQLRAGLLDGLAGRPLGSREVNAILGRNWTVNQGTNLAAMNTRFDGEVSEKQHREMLSDRFSAHRINVEYARRTIALAERHGARVYLIIPPFAPRLQARREATGTDSKYSTFARSLRNEFPRLTVLDGRNLGYPPSAFVDPSHLNREGTVALSRAAGRFLRDDLDRGGSESGRWVHLPADRPSDDGIEREDVEQSKARIVAGRSLSKGAEVR